jgi:hypothetical protein
VVVEAHGPPLKCRGRCVCTAAQFRSLPGSSSIRRMSGGPTGRRKGEININNSRHAVSYKEARHTQPLHKSRLVAVGFEDPVSNNTGILASNTTVGDPGQLRSGAIALPGGGEISYTQLICTFLLGILVSQRWFWSFLHKALVSCTRRLWKEPQPQHWSTAQQRRLQDFRAQCSLHKTERVSKKWIDFVLRYQEEKNHETAVRHQRALWSALGRKTEKHQWCRDFRARTQEAQRQQTTILRYRARA